MKSQHLASLLILVACHAVAEPRDFEIPKRSMTHSERWRPLDLNDLPPPRTFAAIARAGASTLLFGGLGAEGPLGDGWRWDGERWTRLGAEGAPSPRVGHVCVWSGERLCVWGGASPRRPRGDGACWDPVTDRWTPITSENAPSPRARAGAAVHGGRVVIFGGEDAEGEGLADGAIYDPVRDLWTPLPEGGPRPRIAPWILSARGLLALGGGEGEALALGGDDGAWLDLSGPRWIPLAWVDGPLAREGALVVLSDETVISIGEHTRRFDLASGVWRVVEGRGAPSRRWSAAGAAVPGGAVVWGGVDGVRTLDDGARYDLATDRWSALPREGAPSPRQDATAFYDGAQLIVLWGRDAEGLRADGFALAMP